MKIILFLTQTAFFWDNTRYFIVEEVHTHYQSANDKHLRHEDTTKLVRIAVMSYLDLDRQNVLYATNGSHVLRLLVYKVYVNKLDPRVFAVYETSGFRRYFGLVKSFRFTISQKHCSL